MKLFLWSLQTNVRVGNGMDKQAIDDSYQTASDYKADLE